MRHSCRIMLSLSLPVLLGAGIGDAAPDRATVLQYAVESGERTRQAARELPGNLSSRDLFAYALVLCEADTQLDRLERLFDVAARMQDRDLGPTPLRLPAGELVFQLLVREDGTAVDRMYITADPDDRPAWPPHR